MAATLGYSVTRHFGEVAITIVLCPRCAVMHLPQNIDVLPVTGPAPKYCAACFRNLAGGDQPTIKK